MGLYQSQQAGVLPGDGGGAPRGKVRADGQELFPTIQGALDNAQDTVTIGPGTFKESLTVSTAELSIRGSGLGTIVDGTENGHPFTLTANNITLENLSLNVDSNTTAYNCVTLDDTGDQSVIRNVAFRNTSQYGVYFDSGDYVRVESCAFWDGDDDYLRGGGNGDYVSINNCHFYGGDAEAIQIPGHTAHINSCLIRGPAGDGIRVQEPTSRVINTTIENAGGDNGILIGTDGHDTIITGNTIINTTGDGIWTGATNTIITNNRVAGSGGTDIDTASGTTPKTDNNITGPLA